MTGIVSLEDLLAAVAESFEVIGLEGDDFRRRHFERDPGRGYFMDPARFALDGPYGKKLSRCLSGMEEMLSE